MNRDGFGEVLIVALLFSVAVHLGVMVYARPKVMTHIVHGDAQMHRREFMRVTKDVPKSADTVSMDVVDDVEAKKDAPKAKDESEAPRAEIPTDAPGTIEKDVPVAAPITPSLFPSASEVPEPERFVATELKTPEVSKTLVPTIKVAPPPIGGAGSLAPDAGAPAAPSVAPVLEAPAVAPVSAEGFSDAMADLPVAVEEEKQTKPEFTPPEEVMQAVDEKIVEQTKDAVRTLVDAEDAKELAKYVNVAISSSPSADGWTYFRVMMSPRRDLKPVPKDVVILLDASGSIGPERMASVRKAAKKILRSAANTGDRFNLVAFRDRYSYAFRTWQECTVQSYAAADKWLDGVAPHGRTDVFSTISSVLTLPRNPTRPLIALVVTDGDANTGVSATSEILSKFTALNDGLVSIYMYGVKASANRELIDVLTHGNRGESFIFEGWRWGAGNGLEGLSDRFRDPVLSDLRVIFAAGTNGEVYPRRLKNIYRGGTLEFYGRVPAGTKEVSFSLKGLNGADAFESFFTLPLGTAAQDAAIVEAFRMEKVIDAKLSGRGK